MSKDPLLDLIKRRHPRYEEKLAHWDFLEATYEGGRSWFKENIFRFMKAVSYTHLTLPTSDLV